MRRTNPSFSLHAHKRREADVLGRLRHTKRETFMEEHDSEDGEAPYVACQGVGHSSIEELRSAVVSSTSPPIYALVHLRFLTELSPHSTLIFGL
jgi:hypothetical protein